MDEQRTTMDKQWTTMTQKRQQLQCSRPVHVFFVCLKQAVQ